MAAFDRQITAEIAVAKIVGTTGGVVTGSNLGFSTITRTGTGVYTCQREAGGTGASLPAAEVQSYAQCNGSAARLAVTSETAGDTTTVHTFNDSGSAADCDFTITVRRLTNHE